MPGVESGITISRKAWKRVAPSMRAACSSWTGMLSKKPLSSQIESGSPKVR